MKQLEYLKEDCKDFFFRYGPSHAIALFRIASAAFLFVAWLSLLLHAKELSNTEWLLFGGVLLNLFLIMIGAWMRIAAIIIAVVYMMQLGILYMSEVSRTDITNQHAALFFTILFFILACSGADRAFSYEMYKRYGTFLEWEDIHILPQRLLAILISAVYLIIGYHTLWQSIFQSGAKLQSALIGPLGSTLGARIARAIPTTYWNWIMYALKAFGLMLPFCLWITRVQIWFMLGGVLLHIAIALLFGKIWLLILIPGYLLFFDPDEVQKKLTAWEKTWRKN